jgi:hypothetical protein
MSRKVSESWTGSGPKDGFGGPEMDPRLGIVSG